MAVAAMFTCLEVHEHGPGRYEPCDEHDEGAVRARATIYTPDGADPGWMRYVRGKHHERVVMAPVTSGGPDDPNAQWAEASPSGSFEMQIDNPGAWGYFEVGQDYRLEITKRQPQKARG